MKKENNRGFSLIEIIVVLAIMGLAVAGSVSLYSSLSRAKVNSATNYIDSQLSLTRTNSLSKKGYWMFEISVDDGVYYATVFRDKDGSSGWEEFKKEKLGSVSDVDITFTKLKYDDATGAISKVPNVDVSSHDMRVFFDSSSGACMKSYYHVDMSNYYVADITITDGKLTKVISLTRTTGKHYVD